MKTEDKIRQLEQLRQSCLAGAAASFARASKADNKINANYHFNRATSARESADECAKEIARLRQAQSKSSA